jgi:hypothetical protein
MLPLTRSRNRSRFFGIPFSPSSLFAAGEQGAWYDPSDYSTLFQDSAGTTPVTAVEQFVGLMLDKSGRGNHAFQTTSAKRPKLAARYNLLTYSEDMGNAAWSGTTTVTTNTTTAPNGTATADTITAATTGSQRYLRRSPAGLIANTAFTYAVYIKKNTTDWVALRFWDTNPGTAAWFNVGSGTLGTVQSGCTASIIDAGNGWYRCSITRTIGGSIAFNECDVMLSSADNSNNATAGDSVFVWGADLRPASQATGLIGPTYQRVAAATVYDTAGFLPYLAFDGLSWSMSAGDVIDLGTNDLTGFVGVQQNGVTGTYYAKSVAATAAGRYAFFRDTSTLTGFYSNGAGDQNATVSDSNAANRVLSQLLFRSAGANTVRQNGAQVAAATPFTPESTNYNTTYRFLIGAYNNNTDTGEISFLNGNLYSVIVVLAQLSASQISATESWVAGKTGVSI